MELIQSDIRTFLTPSWMTSVPLNLGDASHGKLKADQWHALGTTYLPISLTHLWGFANADSPRSRRCREILNLTISLLSAVTIASSRSMSHALANSYLQHMQAYLAGLKLLFPEYQFRPNHHLALHLHEYLLRFGPVHAWWTFPFERMIGMLQCMPTSGKIGILKLYFFNANLIMRFVGELEETMAKSFVRSANLRALVFKSQCPEVIQNCHSIFRKFTNPQLRDTLQTDMQVLSSLTEGGHDDDDDDDDSIMDWDDRTARPIPNDLQIALTRFHSRFIRKAQFLPIVTINGLVYTPTSKHEGNSCVLFQPKSQGDLNLVPAWIQTIFRIPLSESVQTLIAIRRHQPSQIPHDPFSQFPILRARLWGAQLGDLEIIQLDQVSSHFACLPINGDFKGHVATISLSRVSLQCVNHNLSFPYTIPCRI